MQIYWNKRNCFHKKRVQVPEDWFGTPTWPPFHCFGTPIWPPWRHVKTLHTWANCLFSSKFSFVNSSSWLFQEAAEHYQVTFATGVKRRKVGSPFSLTLFLPWFWHFKLFLRLWKTSQQYKPTPKKFKEGANLLFRGLIIANTYASSVRNRVSCHFQSIHHIRVDRRKRCQNATSGREFFWKWRKKGSVFKRIRILVDRA